MGYARIKLSFQTVVILWKLFDFLSPGGKNNRIKKKKWKRRERGMTRAIYTDILKMKTNHNKL